METATLVAVFLGAFIVCSILFFAGFVGGFLRWASGRPRQENVVLGNDMRGRIATVEEINQGSDTVRIRFGSEYWRADVHNSKKTKPLHVGDDVQIVGVDGLTLKVKPVRR